MVQSTCRSIDVFQDVTSLLTASDDEHMVAMCPLLAIELKAPPDGLPSINDWVTTATSFLFGGCRLHREPIDLFVKLDKFQPGHTTDQQFYLGIKKGFTRMKLGRH